MRVMSGSSLSPGVLALLLLSACSPSESTFSLPSLGLCWGGQPYSTWTPLLSKDSLSPRFWEPESLALPASSHGLLLSQLQPASKWG